MTRPTRCWGSRPSVPIGWQALPDSLRSTAMAEALEAIVDLDLTELAEVKLPRGYGRD